MSHGLEPRSGSSGSGKQGSIPVDSVGMGLSGSCGLGKEVAKIPKLDFGSGGWKMVIFLKVRKSEEKLLGTA